MKDYAKGFYRTKQWQSVRDFVMSRDARLCQDCLKQGRITMAEEVHHVIPITKDNIKDPEITLNPDNLISLCRECHKLRHGAHDRRYKVDELGRVVSK